MANAQVVDLTQPVAGLPRQAAPLVLRVYTRPNVEAEGGVLSSGLVPNSYVLVKALPEELQRRVELAVQTAAAAF